MPTREVLTCSKCGRDIEEDPLLGDRQGGKMQIVHQGFTWDLVLCTVCKQPLYDLYGDCVEKVIPGGTAVGVDTLKYLPRIVDEGPQVQPPAFSGEG